MTTPTAAPAAPVAAAAPAPAADPVAAAPAAAAPVTSLLPAAAPAADPAAPAAAAPVDPNSPDAWVLMEGVQGTGKRPEFFKADKYATLADQAKAYTDLEKRFGSFVGAPKETYDIKLPEGTGVELVGDHPLLDTFQKWGKENQLSQKGFTELMGMLGQYEAQNVVDMGAVKASLGDKADARITAAAQWANANLGADGYKLFQEATSGANAAAVFQLMESVIGKTVQARVPKPGDDVPAGNAATATAEIEKLMQEKDAKGGMRYFTDAKFRAEIEKKRMALYAA
ncbi:MAG: hypothetical protein ACREXP_00075 [Steroidobacteraceae bacterium]